MPDKKKSSRSPEPVVNLTANLSLNDSDFRREILRPINIKEDVKLMSGRKRVSLILSSESFRKDLEDIVKLQLHSGPFPDNLSAIHSLSDFLQPQSQYGVANSLFNKGLVIPAMPINDLGSSYQNIQKMSRFERVTRCKLTSLLRLIDLFGWSSGMDTSVSCRLSDNDDHFLANPFGLLFHEITASSLVKVDSNGKILNAGSANLHIDNNSWNLPLKIYNSQSQNRCILQIKNPIAVAISTMRCGLLPISKDARLLGEVQIYQKDDDLSKINTCHVVLVPMLGIFILGSSVEEAWHYAFLAMSACSHQIQLLPTAPEKLALTPGETVAEILKACKLSDEDMLNGSASNFSDDFELLMRQLDAAGYHTGCLYKCDEDDISLDYSDDESRLKSENSITGDSGVGDTDDIIIPPAIGLMNLVSTENLSTCPTYSDKAAFWKNTPNAYKKTQITEIGTENPKMITRWQPAKIGEEEECSTYLEVVNSPDQFAPQGEDPLELIQTQKSVKQNYFEDCVQPGPQSRIVSDGTTEEARKLQDAREGKLKRDHVVVVGAVSKAIINRQVQHNVSAYRNIYSTNPFHQVTDEELSSYHKEIRINQASPEQRLMIEKEIQQQMDKLRAKKVEEVFPQSTTKVSSTPLASKVTPVSPSTGKISVLQSGIVVSETPKLDTSLTSETEITTQTEITDAETTDKEKKKKRRFKIPSFRKTKK